MEIAFLLNRKLGGCYFFPAWKYFPGFPRKVEMRQEQNSYVRKIFLC